MISQRVFYLGIFLALFLLTLLILLIAPPSTLAQCDVASGCGDLILVYDEVGVFLINISDMTYDIRGFSFSGPAGTWNSSEWDVSRLGEADCVQLFIYGNPNPRQPEQCDVIQTWAATAQEDVRFWLDDFTVSRNGEEIAQCSAQAGMCILLPITAQTPSAGGNDSLPPPITHTRETGTDTGSDSILPPPAYQTRGIGQGGVLPPPAYQTRSADGADSLRPPAFHTRDEDDTGG